MKMFHLHTYFDEDQVQAKLKGQLGPNIHFENQYIFSEIYALLGC